MNEPNNNKLQRCYICPKHLKHIYIENYKNYNTELRKYMCFKSSKGDK